MFATTVAHSILNASTTEGFQFSWDKKTIKNYMSWQGSCSEGSGTIISQCQVPFWILMDDNLCSGLLKAAVDSKLQLAYFTSLPILQGFGAGRCIFSGSLSATFQTGILINNTKYAVNATDMVDIRSNAAVSFRELNMTRLPECNDTLVDRLASADLNITLTMRSDSIFQLQVYMMGSSIFILLSFVTAFMAFVWPMFMIRDLDTHIVNGTRSFTALRIYDLASLKSAHTVRKGNRIRISTVGGAESITISASDASSVAGIML
ncbi:hypothetical protein BJ742DRAFT_200207 [Cladochytrium replicatum]|nr:hypothetical protein BJ742DRAFT_200207 [Cladochytrium replicatum]